MSERKVGEPTHEFAPGMFMIHDLVEENGKTIRENKLEIQHKIPIGVLVEVKYDDWYGDGACQRVHARLWVIEHARDCDGTPLYVLGRYRDMQSRERDMPHLYANTTVNGIPEQLLTPVEVTQAIRDGEGALDWDDEP